MKLLLTKIKKYSGNSFINSLVISLILHGLLIIPLLSAGRAVTSLPGRKGDVCYININHEEIDKNIPDRELIKEKTKSKKNKDKLLLSKHGRTLINSGKDDTSGNRIEKSAAPSVTNSSVLTRNYDTTVLIKIHKSKYYPIKARLENLEGIVVVSFSIKRDGSLDRNSVEIVSESKFELLNRAAVKTIFRADPFKPFPDSMNMEKLSYSVPIKYDLNRWR